MTTNRRAFIQASTAFGLLGVTQASAQNVKAATAVVPGQPGSAAAAVAPPGQSPAVAGQRWIGFLHSAAIDPIIEVAFLKGLREGDFTNSYEGDELTPLNALNRVSVRKLHALGKYGRTRTDPLNNAAQEIQTIPSTPNVLVIAGGNVGAVAANNLTWASAAAAAPTLVVMGRPDSSVNQVNILGVYFETSNPKNVLSQKINYLMTTYNVATKQMCLLYNGNSNMAQAQLSDWASLAPDGKQVDASEPANTTTTVSNLNNPTNQNQNVSINFSKALQAAIAQIGPDSSSRAIILTADPYFTMRRGRIVRIIKSLVSSKSTPVNKLIMCYPLTEYRQAAEDAGFTVNDDFMVGGPSLAAVYNTLGTKAAQVLGGMGAGDFQPRF